MSGGDARVSIPNNVRKLIQEISKTLAFKYSDEFVYAMLKDCDMDPKEAGRRLKMIHGIIEIAGKHSVDDVYTMLKDCNMDPNEAAQRLLYIDTFHEVKKKHDRRKTRTGDTSVEHKWTRGNQWWGAKDRRRTFFSLNGFDDVGGGRHLSSRKEYSVTNRQERVLKPPVPVRSGKENNIAHVSKSAVNVNGSTLAIPNKSCSYKLVAPEVSADVSSSTSDPVVVPSNQTCAVGTIKCEIVKRSISSESNARLPVGMQSSGDIVVASRIPVVAEATDSNDTVQPKSDVVEKTQTAKSLMPISLSTQNSSQVVNPEQDNHSPQLLNESLKVTTSEHMNESIVSALSVHGEESELKKSAHKLNVGLEKLTVSSHQPVIFPHHLLVPDNFASQFTFGSLDCTPDDRNMIQSTQQNGVVTEPMASIQNAPATAAEGEFKDRALPHLSEHVLSSQDNVSSDYALEHEQKRLQVIPPIAGFPHPFLQSTRDYTFGYMPHLMGPHFVHADVPELQGGKSLIASALGPTQAQNSIAFSPPLFPYFRQPYPNYISYNPYFPHMFLPQNAHLFNHGVFPQQPPTGNTEVQAALAGLKFPIPSQHKQESNTASLKPPVTYGSMVGYGDVVIPGPGTGSSANEDLAASQSKENSLHAAAQKGNEPQVWGPAVGVPNYFYNFHHGPHMAFSTLQAGLNHSFQTMSAQSHTTGGMVEPMVPPPSSYEQINWNTTLLNRETV